ncbi:MAG TPA: IclR family transcriptional regulator C-terminal domain-containing protein [Noviherbaspirillum sp.]|nr:IclR family transcriptional regulator C-terminal domain-containing protein [Noviherbaspirillum sp.]
MNKAARTEVRAEEKSPEPAKSRENSVSSSSKILNILDLYSVDRTTLHIDDVAQTFDVSQSTAYRYLKELCDAGFLAQLGKGNYSLGPKIVELERLLRLTDPLYIAGTLAMANLKDLCEKRALLLCTLYNDRVLCIQKAGVDALPMNGKQIPIMRDRGTPFPLFKGAGSLAILAHLPQHRIKSLYLANQTQISEAGLGETWKDFREKLSAIRKDGYAMTVGQVNTKMLGIAVPIILSTGEVSGSLLLLTQNSADERERIESLVSRLQAQSEMISSHVFALQQA